MKEKKGKGFLIKQKWEQDELDEREPELSKTKLTITIDGVKFSSRQDESRRGRTTCEVFAKWRVSGVVLWCCEPWNEGQLFALAYHVTGSEEEHEKMREIICDFIGRTADSERYLLESKMRVNKIWGSSEEMFAAAKIFDCVVASFSTFGRRLVWQFHPDGTNSEGEEQATWPVLPPSGPLYWSALRCCRLRVKI